MGSNLVLHCGAKETDRASLSLIEPPPKTETWFPVKHSLVLDLVAGMLEQSGLRIKNERLGISKDSHRFFGTLDLETPLVEGVTGLSVGIRNSTDQTFPLGSQGPNKIRLYAGNSGNPLRRKVRGADNQQERPKQFGILRDYTPDAPSSDDIVRPA